MSERKSTSRETTDLQTTVLWNRFQAITEEMYDTTERLAFSFPIREAADESATLMTSECLSIGESLRNVPVLSGGVSRAARIIFDEHFSKADLTPGDVIITNDPWIGCGHLSDVVVLSPVFFDEEVVAISGTVGHVGDVGGMMGAWATDTQQVYEEGILVPPCKFYESGNRNATVESFIRENVRIPDQTLGDIEALRSACTLGEERLQTVLEEYGLSTFKQVTDDILERSAEALRQKVVQIPDGTYERQLPFSVGEHDLEISTTATIDGGTIRVDFAGSSDEIPAGINCPFTSTRAATAHTLKALIIPEMNNADGVWEHIEITAPEGTIVNTTRPHATDGRHLTYHPVQNAVIQALEEALPDRVLTGSAGANIDNFNGVDEDGNEFVTIDANFGPFPARANHDGLNCVYFPSEGQNVPREMFEQYCPVRIEERGLARDTEGAGEYRSGLATRTIYHNPTDKNINVSITSDEEGVPPAGLQGGEDGRTSSVRSLNRDRDQALKSNGRFKLQAGERLEVMTASCGGYGNPTKRDPEKVARDLKLGYISEERAKEAYGYAVDDSTTHD